MPHNDPPSSSRPAWGLAAFGVLLIYGALTTPLHPGGATFAVIAGLVTQTWTGALLGFLWGGLVRVFFVHHVTWSINSVCHIWGSQPFRSHDHSRNNPIFGYIALGEGWHNNHHAFPTSARHGLRWWELDLSWIVIRAMALVRLASDIRTPSKGRIAAKRADAASPIDQDVACSATT